MKKLCFLIGVVMLAWSPAKASAQSPVRVTVNANGTPIFGTADASKTPLRLAEKGSILNVIAADGDWYRVEFGDPQFGNRVGYIEKRYATMQVVDVSVADAKAAPQSERSPMFFPASDEAIQWALLPDAPVTKAWSISGVSNLTPWFGILGEVSGYHVGASADFLGHEVSAHLNTFNFLAGPRFVERRAGRIVPFVQLLTGAAVDNARLRIDGESASVWASKFMIQPGGGADIQLTDVVAVRLQIDYIIRIVDGGTERAFRFAPGIVISKGQKSR